MTIIVEDGTGVVNANSYQSEAQLIAYAALYGIEIPDTATAAILLLKGMDYLESNPLSGDPVTDEQLTHYPADNAYVNGTLIANDIVPRQAIKALNEICLSIFSGYDPLATPERGIKEETMDGFKTVYDDVAFDTYVSPRIDLFIAPLISESDSGNGYMFRINY